ncbi:DeoR/GlpR family DNA-binding transcription regulator [Microbacterium invictum]|uniref:Lactose phosphotransferase system repressor n=1 Tax=Microbacterium invictum TaxID=515415 RepID=A0ABZ0VEP5_9MICO|nr:DeoR/GlpR family DNA-binding transcription regulator [Microbacterium invictum]WQB71909.1 DeoR/GlpR family DNA-binding transcription regulator [Microbacterium invictum]
MYATERQDAIERQLLTAGRVSVVDLARDFGVTTETIRRDLDAMERDGALRRVHGGAVAASRGGTSETAVGDRGAVNGEEKARIAVRAAEALAGLGGSLFIDAGTTTAAFARDLAARTPADGAARLELVTHAVPIAFELGARADLPLTVIGGRVRGMTAAAVGAAAVEAVSQLRPDVAVVGTNGISAAFGLSTPDPEEAAVKRAIVAAARRVIVLADASKVDAEYLVRFAGLEDIDVLVTDAAPSGELASALRTADVEVWTA